MPDARETRTATLTILRGLPASGKTTLAKAMVAQDPARRARVNRDELRLMLHDGVYLGHETEGQVVDVEDWTIRKLLKAQVDVYCDDTNLSQKRARQLAEIAAGEGARWRVSDLTDVDVELCVLRDLARAEKGERAVGEPVIRGMYERYLKGRVLPLPPPEPRGPVEVEPYVARPGTPRAVLVDLDGTLCLHNGRSPYDESRVGDDLPNRAVVEAIQALRMEGFRVVFASGRTEGCRAASERWIVQHVFGPSWRDIDEAMPYDGLFMRAEGDTRRDSIVKRELFDAHVRDRYDVVFVLDDRQQVVDMWRQLGLTVFQVAPGNF
jgi:predicted kinase